MGSAAAVATEDKKENPSRPGPFRPSSRNKNRCIAAFCDVFISCFYISAARYTHTHTYKCIYNMDIVYKAKSPVRLEDLVRGVAGRGEGGGQFTLFRHETCCVLFLFFFTNFTAKGQQ